jgi:acetoin utilization deacetylase AcuC-like enzyme
MTTGLIYDPIFLEHFTPEGHPERPERLQVAMQVLEGLHWLEREGLVLIPPRTATIDELTSVHELAYIH